MAINVETNSSTTGFLSKPILVPLDGTSLAEGILPYVSQIAKRSGVCLLLLTVVDPDDIPYPSTVSYQVLGAEPRVIHRHQVEEEMSVSALSRLNRAASDLGKKGVQAEAAVAIGKSAEEIIRVAADRDCGLVAMSTHGRNAVARGVLGSVANKVLHASAVPVMAVTPDKARGYFENEGETLSTVIVPLDGSELAETALPYAEDLARALGLNALLVRAVWSAFPPHYAEHTDNLPDWTEGMMKDATAYLDGTLNNLKSRGIAAQGRVLQGMPVPSILDLAHNTPQSFITMTTHARSGPSRWMMEGVAEALVRGSGEPVLAIRPRP